VIILLKNNILSLFILLILLSIIQKIFERVLTQAFKIDFNLFSHFPNLFRMPVLESFNPNLDWALTKLGSKPSYYSNRTKKEEEKEIVKRGDEFRVRDPENPRPSLSLFFFFSSSRTRPPSNHLLVSASSTMCRRREKENCGPLTRLTYRQHPPTPFLLFSLVSRAREPRFDSPEPTTHMPESGHPHHHQPPL